jgi:hypothetical protein
MIAETVTWNGDAREFTYNDGLEIKTAKRNIMMELE